mmetsp:Transcript_40023/g.103617  ORF Transcript_40023/g.103617 Transcript_40023/m.103617 type:complete len:299 (+) Transcript_40023:248-1144(+)
MSISISVARRFVHPLTVLVACPLPPLAQAPCHSRREVASLASALPQAGSSLAVGLAEVVGDVLEAVREGHACRAEGLAALLEAGRADLAVRLEVLQGIKHAHGLVHITAQGLVVHELVAHDAALVDQEEAAVRGAVVREHVVLRRHLFLEVREQRVADLADAALARLQAAVGEVRVDGVRRHGDHLGAFLAEVLDNGVERHDLGRAHEGEVERVEEQDHVLPLEALQTDLLRGVVRHGCRQRERGRLLLDQQPALSNGGQEQTKQRSKSRHCCLGAGGDASNAGRMEERNVRRPQRPA